MHQITIPFSNLCVEQRTVLPTIILHPPHKWLPPLTLHFCAELAETNEISPSITWASLHWCISPHPAEARNEFIADLS